MPYSKTAWVDNSTPAIDAANLNNIEDGISKAPYGPDAAANKVPVGQGSASWLYQLLVNANIDPAAAIAYTKLALTGSVVNADIANAAAIAYSKLALSNSIVNADIAAAAAIAYSKLALTGSLVNADVAAAAAIAISKLADPGSGNVIGSLGSGAVALKPPGTELDYKEATADVSITATAFASATTLLTGNAVTLDGTAVWVEVFSPHVTSPSSTAAVFLNVWDGSTDLGVLAKLNTSAGGTDEAPVYARRKYTPSAGSHTFSIRGTMNAGTGTFGAGAGGTGGTFLPAFLRISKA